MEIRSRRPGGNGGAARTHTYTALDPTTQLVKGGGPSPPRPVTLHPDADGRRSIVGLQPKRADVILAGACIVRTVMEKLGQDTVTVSDRGLRHGLLIDRFGPPPHP